ncbi:MAG: VOC family protein [Alphaproteobacteria bacterium]|nr:VOC family protein [Alphaproteobacteria bacterium]
MIGIKRVKRIAVAVYDLDQAVKNWERLFGVKTFQVGQEPDYKYHWAGFEIGDTRGDGEMTMEFLSPMDDPEGTTLIGKYLKKYGEGLYMITLETEGTADDVVIQMKETGLGPSWGGNQMQWTGERGMDGVGIESWTENYLNPKDANGVLVTLASINYLPPKVVKTQPGKTLEKND